LAILYPNTHFTLVDSIGKKIKVVQALADALELKNVEAVHARVESLPGGFRTAVTRAVAPMPQLLEWMRYQWAPGAGRRLLALKGGDLTEELQGIPHCTVHPLADRIPLEFFSTKAVVEVRVR
jgi:16S rRNA (guanine527-N7)-methyltransferase